MGRAQSLTLERHPLLLQRAEAGSELDLRVHPWQGGRDSRPSKRQTLRFRLSIPRG
jgi:hypothetical protein